LFSEPYPIRKEWVVIASSPFGEESFIRIHEADVSGVDDDSMCYLWGRVWAQNEKEGFGFYVCINGREKSINGFDLINRSRVSDLNELHAEQDLDSFQEALRSQITPQDRQRASFRKLKDDFEETLENQPLDNLPHALKNRDEESVGKWVDDFLYALPLKGELQYQVTARAIAMERMISSPEEEHIISSQDGEKIRTDRYLRIEPETVIQKGTLAKDLSEGDYMLYRVVGESVNYVNPSMVARDDSDDPESVPFRGIVEMIIRPTSLPERVEGRPENHRQVFVRVTPEVTGIGYIHENDQILTDWAVSVDYLSVENLVMYALISLVSITAAGIVVLLSL